MTIEELKREAGALEGNQRSELIAHLTYLELMNDPEFEKETRRAMDDNDPSHWLTLDEFERRLDENGE